MVFRFKNLFMLLLLCMTLGVFAVSCTGEDGRDGVDGKDADPEAIRDAVDEALEESAGGETTEEVVEDEPTAFFDFLKTWGSETGEVACSDPLLTGTGPLPGPEMLEALSVDDAAINGGIAVSCSDTGLFLEFTTDITGDGQPDQVAAGADNTVGNEDDVTAEVNQFTLVKTGRGSAEEEVIQAPATEFSPATEVTINKIFVGGVLGADMDMRGETDEPEERRLLYSQCGVGTAPSAVRGTWRAVKITESAQAFNRTTGFRSGAPVETVTTKLCIVLDSVPGATKCYVKVVGPEMEQTAGADTPANTDDDVFSPVVKESIALYDGEELNTINDEPDVPRQPDSQDTPKAVIEQQPAVLFATGDFAEVGKLCNLFEDGVSN